MKTELRRRGVVPNRFWPKQNGYNGPRVFTLTFAVHMFDSTKLALDVLDVPTGARQTSLIGLLNCLTHKGAFLDTTYLRRTEV